MKTTDVQQRARAFAERAVQRLFEARRCRVEAHLVADELVELLQFAYESGANGVTLTPMDQPET